jgi:hypothetical protein
MLVLAATLQPELSAAQTQLSPTSSAHGLLASRQCMPNTAASVRFSFKAGTPVAATSWTTANRAPSIVAFSADFHQKKASVISTTNSTIRKNGSAMATNSTVTEPV